MDSSEIQRILNDALVCDEIFVKGEGSHFEVIAVGQLFDGMSRVKKQQTIYAPLMEHISSNAIHALTMKTYIPTEWARDKKLLSL